ncbi:ferritin family protein [bacterium]|nr:ferritin family protein [bacterium]
MFHKFNAKEIFEMAETIEKNGYEFYRKAANDAKDPEIKQFLLELAEMEVGHEKMFLSLKSKLSGKEKEEVVFDPYEETEAYLEALANTRVFFEKKINTKSAEDVFKAAIEAEKDSIIFYLGIRDMVPEELGKDKVEKIIKEEMKHVQIISNQLLKLKNK